MSVDELYQSYLVRSDYSRRPSKTQGKRTQIHHDWKTLPTVNEIGEVLGYMKPGDGYMSPGRNERTLLNLRVAVDVAIRDALSPGWLRTPEQIQGGAFPGPWLKPHSRNAVEAFLIEYDVARASPVGYKKMMMQVDALVKHLHAFSQPIHDNLIEQIARTHNYAHLLVNNSTTDLQGSSVASTVTPRNDAKTLGPAVASPQTESSTAGVKGTAPVPPAAPVPSVTTEPSSSTSAEAAILERKARNLSCEYHRDQDILNKELYDAAVSSSDKERLRSLFRGGSGTVELAFPSMLQASNYSDAFVILNRTPGWTMSPKMSQALRGTICKREEVHSLYERLSARGLSSGDDGGHVYFLNILKLGEAKLLTNSG